MKDEIFPFYFHSVRIVARLRAVRPEISSGQGQW